MLNFPVSFALSFCFLLLSIRVLLLSCSGRRGRILLALTLGIYAAQSAFIGLRWGYQAPVPWLLQVGVTLAVPVLTWSAISHLLASSKRTRPGLTTVIHLVNAYALCALGTLWPPAIDILITLLYVGYGTALLFHASEQTSWAEDTLASSFLSANRVLLAAGLLLIGSTMIDILVAADIGFGDGMHAADIVGFSNLASLLLLSLLLIGVDRKRSPALFELFNRNAQVSPGASLSKPVLNSDRVNTAHAASTILPDDGSKARRQSPNDRASTATSVAEARSDAGRLYNPVNQAEMRAERLAVLKRVDEEILERKLYRDPNLTLDRIARKLVIPSRHISSAINSEKAMNLSQYVNAFRIDEARELLAKTDTPVSQIVFEVGFQTKSNFNREFQRICGMSPSAWRAADRQSNGLATPPQSDRSSSASEENTDRANLNFIKACRESPSYS